MSVSFGLAIKNFVGPTETPNVDEILAYAERAEELGFESLWAWDHVILGVEPAFPIIDALSILTAIAVRTSRIKLGTGILVLPLRNPTVLAKQIGSLDHISKGRFILGTAVGWYAREFGAVGVDFKRGGRVMDRKLEILTRLLTWEKINGFAAEEGRDPSTLTATNQLAIYVGQSREAVQADMRHWLETEWDIASWSESTIDHAIQGSG